MKIYRGPYTKSSDDRSHELVDSRDLSWDTDEWSEEKRIYIDITKRGSERRSKATVILEEQDVFALHTGLMKGVQTKLKAQRRALLQIRKLAIDGYYAEENIETFKKILSIINETLEPK